MWIKTIIAVGMGAIISVAGARAQTPSTAPIGTDYFYSGTYQGGVAGGNTTRTTGTQGVVGNPNCPQPVEPGGIRPLNWSCPTGTQAVSNNLVAQVLNQNGSSPGATATQQTPQASSRRAQTGNATQSRQTGEQQATQRQGSQLTPGQRAMLRRSSGRVQTVNNQTGNTGGGSAINRQLDSEFGRRNNTGRASMIRAAAEATGQRPFNFEHPNSALGTNYGYGIPAQSSANRGYGRGQFGRR